MSRFTAGGAVVVGRTQTRTMGSSNNNPSQKNQEGRCCRVLLSPIDPGGGRERHQVGGCASDYTPTHAKPRWQLLHHPQDRRCGASAFIFAIETISARGVAFSPPTAGASVGAAPHPDTSRSDHIRIYCARGRWHSVPSPRELSLLFSLP